MVLYSFVAPTQFNSGAEIPRRIFEALEARLITAFGGFTKRHAEGAWEDNGMTFRDASFTYEVLAEENDGEARKIAEFIKNEFSQLSVLVTKHEVTAWFI